MNKYKLNYEQARSLIIVYTLGCTLVLMVFFITSPIISFPFNYSQGDDQRLIQIVLPTLIGYIGMTVTTFGQEGEAMIFTKQQSVEAFYWINGTFAIFAIVVLSLLLTFYVTNLPEADGKIVTDGMSIDWLSWWLAACLGILTAVMNYLIPRIFTKKTAEQKTIGDA